MLIKKKHRNKFSRIGPGTIVFVVCMTIISTCSSSSSSAKKRVIRVPKGWYLSLNNSNVDVIKAREEKKGYTLNIDRPNDPKDNLHYISVAEALYPEHSKILDPNDKEVKNWYFERIWWHEKYRDHPIPYSLTADTINYYIDRYKKKKKEIKELLAIPSTKGSNVDRIELIYIATVSEEGSVNIDGDTLPKIRVSIDMKWYEYCGQPCGWGFEKSRQVVFAGKYRVIEIAGDGFTEKWRSTKENPYGPNQWIRF